MAYISSNNNRWYAAIEPSYGQVPSIGAENRFPAVTLSVQQKVEVPPRKDKTGTRTYLGAPANLRKSTRFDLTTYMTAAGASASTGYSPLFQSALGANPLVFEGGTAAPGSTTLTIQFAAAHGLVSGQAITFGNEIRFVASVVNTQSVILNAPFSTTPPAGATIGQAVTYQPSSSLPSFTLFDYWTPSDAVQRLLPGCGVDQMNIQVNGDYQEFGFSGMAQDVMDSSSFVSGNANLTSFPSEPALGQGPTTVIPGHLGQAWMGAIPSQFLTMTSAKFALKNNLDMRTREFGSILPLAITPGQRTVSFDLGLYGADDSATVGLYQAARLRAPISTGFQMGQAAGQLLGVYLKSVVPEVPDFDSKLLRMQWQFKGSLAQGQGDDEMAVAFG